MSGSASLASALAFAPVFVVKFGGGSSRLNSKNRRKKSQKDNSYWHVCDSLCPRPSFASSSPFSLFLLTFLVVLCSIGEGDGVKGSEISANSSPALFSNTNNGVPSFDINDLRNLIEIFPEFREYVLQVVSSHIEKQQQQNNNRYSDYATTTTEKIAFPLDRPAVYDGGTSSNSRGDYLPFTSQKGGYPLASGQQKTPTALSKHSYGWSNYDDYLPIHDHSHHGYGYGPSIHSSHNNGWGWSSDHAHHHHHHETYKDPKYHYQVGYQLGKDVSCVLGLLGFKSIKDFSIHSIFSFLKKIKYLVLIGLAFKLGVILSPIALPLLFPIILLAVIAKLLPLLLIVVLLFKLLKTQLKLGIGRRAVESSSSGDFAVDTVSSFMEGTNISRLWKSIDDVTQTVVESESCVEKIICKMVQGSERSSSYNATFTDEQDAEETPRSIATAFSESKGIMPSFVFNIMNWIFPNIRMNSTTGENSAEINLWECDKIQCSYMDNS